jgi:hypothetical protein
VTAARVVGVTCLGVTHPLFSKRTFDVCIVDEASQITLPVSTAQPLAGALETVATGAAVQMREADHGRSSLCVPPRPKFVNRRVMFVLSKQFTNTHFSWFIGAAQPPGIVW